VLRKGQSRKWRVLRNADLQGNRVQWVKSALLQAQRLHNGNRGCFLFNVEVFSTLLVKLIPLYMLIGVGYLLGRYSRLRKELVSFLVIYLLAPVIVFNGVIAAPIALCSFSLPLLFFCVCCFLCLFFLYIGSLAWTDKTKNLLGFTGGDANVGLFGLPVAIALFDKATVNLVVLAIVGFMLYENTLGFYIVAKGNYSARKSFLRIITLPTLYAFLLGVLFHLVPVRYGAVYQTVVGVVGTAFTICGMMLIGFGLASMKHWTVDGLFVGLAFFAKFVVWPLVMVLIILLDTYFFHVYNPTTYKAFLLISVLPLAANTVVFATQLRVHPEKASVTVLLSTLFALFFVPFVAVFI
jgi:malate permease and related proteins